MALSGMELIEAERRRQIEQEGFDAAHDAQEQLVLKVAASGYYHAEGPSAPRPADWPWDDVWWKPRDRVRNLTRAGALYLAAADARESAALDADSQLAEGGELRFAAKCCAQQIDVLLQVNPTPPSGSPDHA